MKTVIALAAVAALTGCATQPSTVYYPKPANPYEWHTVSVTPVQRGTAGDSARVEYTTEPVAQQPRVVYTTEPVYATAPVYAPPPVYYAPAPAYYYPPVTIGLDFVFGNWGHRHGYRGHGRRR
ncbi:hypothetical protein ASD15_04720 [Massilia sp. Root351]|jgi:hypothetical protein|uniref:hypothetical protein n=1 Tax=Massilia sp. Root351 TaxID=1736522 RepID=UPI000709FA68|nr:hypothetical protein [Massilia sp. Root351]KQV91342.1 hypothetical protein ASD15_04720 [Massilia sp. Root351]